MPIEPSVQIKVDNLQKVIESGLEGVDLENPLVLLKTLHDLTFNNSPTVIDAWIQQHILTKIQSMSTNEKENFRLNELDKMVAYNKNTNQVNRQNNENVRVSMV